MAALRNGIHTVIIPKENEKDLEEIDQTVRGALQFIPVDHVDQVLANALENAIHACQDLPEEERRIRLRMELTENRRLLASMENPSPPVAFGSGGLPDVPKREGHGLGLPSVKRVADKYGGLFRCQWEQGRFVVRTVLMPPEERRASKGRRPGGAVLLALLALLAGVLLLSSLPVMERLGAGAADLGSYAQAFRIP